MPFDQNFQNDPISRLQTYSLALPSGPAGSEAELIAPQTAEFPAGTPVGATHGYPLSGLRHTDWGGYAPNGGRYQVSLQRIRVGYVNL